MYQALVVILVSLTPVSELRGAIPLGIALGLPPEIVIPIAFIFNCIVFFPVYFALDFFYVKYFSRIWIAKKFIEKAKKKGRPYIKKYGIIGLILFVAIPLPVTGVWTGTAIAWIFGLNWKKSFLAICLGVLIATIIVSSIVFGFVNGLDMLISYNFDIIRS